MVSQKITVLIALIGKHPQHVEHFIREKGNSLKTIHLLHTSDKDQPPSRDGGDGASECKHCGSGGLVDYGTLANKFVKKLQRKYKPEKGKPQSGITIISEPYDDAHDLWELQDRILEIVENEREDDDVQLNNIALEISGGTNIAAAAQIFAIYNLDIVPFYVDNKPDGGGNWVRDIVVPENFGKKLTQKAKNVLKVIAESEFTVKPNGHSETPDGEDPHPVKGQITRKVLQIKLDVARAPDGILKKLEDFKLIEILSQYDVYTDTSDEEDDPTWKLVPYSFNAYKITKAGIIAARRFKISKQVQK